MNKIQMAEQFRRALQMFAANLDETSAMEIATVYDAWKPQKSYKGGEYFTFGVNSVGDPQLYQVIKGKAHTSSAEWTPDVTTSLYTPIGLDDNGYPVWSAPTGAHDAYGVDDIVNYEGTLYVSKIAGNCTVPSTDERYWKVYEG